MSNTIPLSREGRKNETHETLDLGTFEMVSSRMAVSDPCYDADVWCRGELENVLPGAWQAYAVKRDKGEWGPRVVRLVAVHREYADKCETAAELAPFEVGVDSGQAGLFDSLHYRDDTVAVEHTNVSRKDAGKLWYMQCCCRTLTREAAGVMPYGVVASSGYALANAQVMIHDPLITGDCGGPALSVDAISKRLMRTRRKVGEILSQCTGRPLDAVLSATARDTFFDAQQAKVFGLVDEIIADWGDLRHVG